MDATLLVQVTEEGHIVVPQEVRDALGIHPGDLLTLRPWVGGMFISQATSASQTTAEEVLRYLVLNLGPQAEANHVNDEDDLDAEIDEIIRPPIG